MKKKLVRENLAEPTVKPTTKPTTTPKHPSPIRREKPSTMPRPKATAEDVAKRFLSLISKKTKK